jgi:hypothetical protein
MSETITRTASEYDALDTVHIHVSTNTVRTCMGTQVPVKDNNKIIRKI